MCQPQERRRIFRQINKSACKVRERERERASSSTWSLPSSLNERTRKRDPDNIMAIPPVPTRQLFIDGEWREPILKNRIPIVNPSTQDVIGINKTLDPLRFV